MGDQKTISVAGPSIGFSGLLTILFIYLKLTHQIDWSWVWVLCPLWLGIACVLGLLVLLAAVALLIRFVAWTFGLPNRKWR